MRLTTKQLIWQRTALTIIAALALPSAKLSAQQETLRWPSSYKPRSAAKIITVSKGGEGEPFIYRTRNFELRSHSAVTPRNLQLFANIMESVPTVIGKLPLPLLGMPNGERAKVFIYPDEETFTQAGGAAGAGGYYDGRKQAIMLRADAFLKPPSRPGSRLTAPPNYDLLVHEFTHLCMHQDLAYLPVWFTEGTAEYMAAAHQSGGSYQFSNITQHISRHIKKNLPNDKGIIVLPSVVSTMAHTHESWRNQIAKGSVEDHYRSYATALLITHTLFHGGSKRLSATRSFVANIHQSRGRKANPQPETEKLIPAKERDALEKRIVAYWKTRGLRLQFQAPSQ